MKPLSIRVAALASACAGAAVLAGCAATASPDWDSTFGDAARAIQAQQILDPSAAQRNRDAAQATDGRTTRESMERHREGYRTPPPTNVINIGVGAGGGGAAR